MRTTVTMNATDRLEIGFGAVVEGKEAWMAGEYFPVAGPIMGRHGLRTLLRFAVLGSNVAGVPPVQGSLSAWPSADHRVRLHQDPDFAALLPARDAALDLSDGHLFAPLPDTVEVDPDGEFALVIAEDGVDAGPALFRVPFAGDSANRSYAGRHLSMHPWSEATAALLAGSPDRATVLRIRLPPAATA